MRPDVTVFAERWGRIGLLYFLEVVMPDTVDGYKKPDRETMRLYWSRQLRSVVVENLLDCTIRNSELNAQVSDVRNLVLQKDNKINDLEAQIKNLRQQLDATLRANMHMCDASHLISDTLRHNGI